MVIILVMVDFIDLCCMVYKGIDKGIGNMVEYWFDDFFE